MSLKFLAFQIAVAYASSLESPSNANNDPCEPCQPLGATDLRPPIVGPRLNSLYVDVLNSVREIKIDKRTVQIRAEKGFCCRQSLDCVNVQSLNIPMCYDKFTTNYAFPDGSYGSLTTGDYTSGTATANLISGNYTNGSENGNIYAGDPSAKPNTSTLSIPPQYTNAGVGAAIPASELGSVGVYQTTISGTAVEMSTISSQATTTASRTAVATQSTVPSPSVTSTGAAAQVSTDSSRSAGMTILGAIMWAFLAL